MGKKKKSFNNPDRKIIKHCGQRRRLIFSFFSTVVYSIALAISIYSLSLPVAHLSDAARRWLVVTGDSVRIHDKTTENAAWFFNPFLNGKFETLPN